MFNLMSLSDSDKAKVLQAVSEAYTYIEKHQIQITDQDAMLQDLIAEILEGKTGEEAYTKIVKRYKVQ